MNTDVFLGVVMYSQYYKIQGRGQEVLIDNLLRLFIKPEIMERRDYIQVFIQVFTVSFTRTAKM